MDNYLDLSKDFKKLDFSLFQTKETKHKHEYQEVCEELQKTYGKLVWTLPFKPGFTEYKLREAHRIAKERGITKFAYLYGIMKKLK
jgi:hypothetical protein